MIIFQYRIYRSDLELNPDVLYCFGDNDEHEGLGGQAKEVRGERNSFGIRTKRRPDHNPGAFYTDEEYDECVAKIEADFQILEKELMRGKVVVMPTEGFGTGLANLKEDGPRILAYIEARVEGLVKNYG